MGGEEIKVKEDSFLRLLDHKKETTKRLLQLRKNDPSRKDSEEVKPLPDDDAAQLALRLITGERDHHDQSGVLLIRLDTIMFLRSLFFSSSKETYTTKTKRIYDRLVQDLPSVGLKVVTPTDCIIHH